MTDRRSIRAKAQRENRRAIILMAAQKVIGRKGYQATSVADILEAASISRGTFYLYFESREALFHELIDSFISKVMGCIKGVRPEEGQPIEDLYANVRRVIDVLFDHRDLTAILLREAVGLDEKVDRKLNHLYGFLYRMVGNALRHGAAWGILRKVDERVVAMAIIGSIKEALYQTLVVRHEPNPDREVIARELLSFGLQGLKT